MPAKQRQKTRALWRNLELVRGPAIGMAVIALAFAATILIQLYGKHEINRINDVVSEVRIPTMEASNHILAEIELLSDDLERLLLFGDTFASAHENAWETAILPNLEELSEIDRTHPEEKTTALLAILNKNLAPLRTEEEKVRNLIASIATEEADEASRETAKSIMRSSLLPLADRTRLALERQIAQTEERLEEDTANVQRLSRYRELELWVCAIIGVLLVAVVGFVVLRSLIQKAHRTRALESLVTNSSSPVMSCDLEFRITFVNASMKKLFAKYDLAFRNSFPGFDPDKLIGNCIDIFHARPEVQRNILEDRSRLPQQNENIKVAGLEFSSNAGVLLDAHDQPIGYFVEFIDQNDRAAYRDEVARVIEACTSGDLRHRGNIEEISPTYRPMMEGINSVIDAIVEPIPELQAQLTRLAEGDLSRLMQGMYAGDHALIKDALNATTRSLSGILAKVRGIAHEVGSDAEELSGSSQSLAKGAIAQSASLEDLAATMSQVGEQTRVSAENAAQASQLAESVSAMTETGNQTMQQTVESIQAISKSSEAIDEILLVIDRIASQTNLLALNATIEAASAGEAGKGFAVVAGEIKNLARQTGEATAQISETVAALSQRVEQGLSLTHQTAEGQARVLEGIARVAMLLAEIDSSSREQNRALEETTRAITDLNQISRESAIATEQSSATSTSLALLAEDLLEVLETFVLPDSRNLAA